MTDIECKKVGIGMAHGAVFHACMLRRPEDATMVFLSLALASPDDLKAMADKGIDTVYEYMDKAGARGINGYPSFTSCKGLTVEENKKVIAAYHEEVERMKAIED
jgi:hypothetical protein